MVILAAGEGRRFGGIKQLAPFRGRPMAQHIVDACRAVPDSDTFIVLGAYRSAIEPELDLAGVGIIGNDQWREGIASSIRAAVVALAPRYRAMMFVAADQVFLNDCELQTLVNRWQAAPDRIVAARYHDRLGIPVVFPALYYEDLMTLKGDRGAAKLLARPGSRIIIVPLPSAARDIDTPGDLAGEEGPR